MEAIMFGGEHDTSQMEGGHHQQSRLVKLLHFDDIEMSFHLGRKDCAQQYQMLPLLNGLPTCM